MTDVRPLLRDTIKILDTAAMVTDPILKQGIYSIARQGLEMAAKCMSTECMSTECMAAECMAAECKTETLVVAEEQKDSDGSSSAKRGSIYTAYMAEIVPIFTVKAPNKTHKDRFSLAAALWGRHKAAGSLEEILAKAKADLDTMLFEPNLQIPVKTVAVNLL